MQSFTDIFNSVVSIGSVLLFIIALGILYTYFFKYSTYSTTIRARALTFMFIVSGLATIGSLVYSLGIGFPPCDLCWYQRIFMYPIFFLSGVALYKKHVFDTIKPYMRFLVIFGASIALFHTIVYYTGVNPVPCSATASCTARYVFEFGFMTIPLMSLISFVFLGTFILPTRTQ